MSGKIVGYARTASSDQDIDAQVTLLKAAGCSVVYMDRAVSGSGLNRPGLKEAEASLQPGDKLKVVRIDRITRSPADIHNFVNDLARRHIEFEAVEEPDAARMIRLQDALNYGPAITPETPWMRRLAYRLGSFLIRISGCGAAPTP